MTSALAHRIPIAGMRYSRFAARPMTGSFGALVEGVQIADALSDNDINWHADSSFRANSTRGSLIHRGIFDFGQSHRPVHRVSFHDHWRPA